MKRDQLNQLILQSLEHEMGGVDVYEKALECVVNDDLRYEWQKYLTQTRTHVQILEDLCDSFALDSTAQVPGRQVVRTVGKALVAAMDEALAAGNPEAAQLVACEAVTLAETKDHLDWELLGKCASELAGTERDALEAACEKVEDEEDEHLYHTKGWCRELWLQSLGLPAALPPPEEEHEVRTAIGAARAEQASDKGRHPQQSNGGSRMATRKSATSKTSKKTSASKTGGRKAAKKSAGKTTAKRTAKKTATKTARKTATKRGASKKSSSKTTAQRKVKRAMHERKEGTLRSGRSGKKVTSRKQAIAIGLSEARKAGAKVPKKKS